MRINNNGVFHLAIRKNYIRVKNPFIFLGILLACLITSAQIVAEVPKSFTQQVINKYEQLDAFNDENERNGRPDLNKYVIELNPNWIEEKSEKKYTKSYYDDLSKKLTDFNTIRDDKLRVYVMVINDFQGQVKKNVNLKTLPEDIKFGKYVETADEDYKKFVSVVRSLPTEISKALEEKGYENRIIYFCGVIKLYKTKKDESFYLYTSLTAEGPKLETKRYDIAERLHLNWQVADKEDIPETLEPIADKILKGVHNLLDAIEMVIDKGLTNDKRDPRCDMSSLEEVAGSTKNTREIEFNSKTSACATLIKNPKAKQQLSSRYVIVENPDHFKKNVFFHEKLPDKVKMVSEKGFSDYKLYVVYKEINFAMTPDEWPGFAKEVYAQSGLKGNDVLITVPYYFTSCTFPNGYGGETTQKDKLMMPGAYCASNTEMIDGVNAAFPSLALETSNTYVEKRWESVFNQAFKKIPKDYKIMVWVVDWNGDARFEEKAQEEYKGITGYEDLISLRIIQDTRLDEIYKAYTQRNCDAEGRNYSAHDSQIADDAASERMRVCLIAFDNDVEIIISKPPDFIVFEGASELVQSSLNKEVSLQYVLNFVSKKSIKKCKKISENFFYGKNSPFKGPGIFLTFVDLASLAASPFGLDWIFDGVGLIYSISTGDAGNLIIYEIALATPFIAPELLRAARAGLVEGKNLLVKGAKGAYKIVPRKLYGLTFLLKREGEFSHLIRSILHPQSFSKARAFSTEINFIESLEDGLIAEPKAAQAFNDTPELINEFHTFYKEGKGNVSDFFREGRIILGMDDDILKALSFLKKEEGWVDVIVHGNADNFILWHNGTRLKLDHRRLLKYMESQGYVKGTPIRLLSCETGKSSLSIAQFLSDKANAIVKAPNVKIGPTEAGKIVSLDGIEGEMKIFKPGQSTPYSTVSPEKIPTILPTEKAYKLGDFHEEVVDLLAVSKVLVDPTYEALTKYYKDEKFLSAIEDVIEASKQNALKEINDYPQLIHELNKRFEEFGKNKDALVQYYTQLRKKIDVLEQNPVFAQLRKKYLSDEMPRAFPSKLTIEEEAAIRYFSNSGNLELGKALRGEITLTPFHSAFKETINEIFTKLPEYSGITYRGINATEAAALNVRSIEPKDLIVFKDFKTATTSKQAGKQAAALIGEEQYLFVIKSKSGTMIRQISGQLDKEVLFKTDIQYVVVHKEMPFQSVFSTENIVELHLDEVIPGSTAIIRQSGELGPAITHALKELDGATLDPMITVLIDDAIKTKNIEILEELLGLKNIAKDQYIVASNKSYMANVPNKLHDDPASVAQFTTTERKQYELSVKNGQLYTKGQLLEEEAFHIFVQAPDGKIYIARSSERSSSHISIHHSSFLSGENIVTGGGLKVENGKITLNNDSGHYWPSPLSSADAMLELIRRGVDIKSLEFKTF